MCLMMLRYLAYPQATPYLTHALNAESALGLVTNSRMEEYIHAGCLKYLTDSGAKN